MPKCVRKIARSSQKKKSTELARFTAARAAKLAAKIPFFSVSNKINSFPFWQQLLLKFTQLNEFSKFSFKKRPF